jgi:cell division cycle 2-like
MDAQPVDLRQLLPNLPPATADSETAASVVDFINCFLVYPPERRLKASEALRHPWLSDNTLLLPPGYESLHSVSTWENQSLGETLQKYLGSSGGESLGKDEQIARDL